MALAASSAVAAERPQASPALRVADVGRLIDVKPGAEIRIELPVSVGSPYRWHIQLQKHVALIAPIETIDDPAQSQGAPGLPRVAVIRLRAPSTGSASVLLGEAPDGSGGGAASNSYRFRFRVVP